MNTTNHQCIPSRKAAVISSVMCVLAMLVLVVSCPLKLMLQNRIVSNTSAVVKTNHGGKFISSNTCVLATQKILSVKPELSRNSTLPFPLHLPVINEQAGIDIHYLHSGLHLNHFNAASNHYAELPLFLQHMRFLI